MFVNAPFNDASVAPEFAHASHAAVDPTAGSIFVGPMFRDYEDRVVYWVAITLPDKRTLYTSTELRSAVNEEPDARKALASLLSFLLADAEKYAAHGQGEPADGYCTARNVAEWAYTWDTEIQALAEELEGGSDDA